MPRVEPWTSLPSQPADPPGDRQDQREGEVGGGLGEHPGCVADGDSLPGGVGDVDVVGADGEVGDRPQLRAGVDQFGVDRIGDHGEDPLGPVLTGDEVAELGPRWGQRAAPELDLMLGPEPLERREGKLSGHDAAGHRR